MSDFRVTIVGAGLAGSLLACYFGRRGYRVGVYERRPDPRERGFIGGRSINLALSTRGIAALAHAGLDEQVMDQAIPMRGRMMHDEQGKLSFQPYSKNPNDAINSISRGGLNLLILETAEKFKNVSFHFDHCCTDVEPKTATAIFANGTEERRVSSDFLVGADGAFSAVRRRMQKTDRFSYSQAHLDHGYKELTIPPTSQGEFALEPNALHIWPRGGFMMIALPNNDRSFTCTLFWPFEGPNSFDMLDSADKILPFFQKHFPDAVSLLPDLVEQFQKNPTSSLMTVRCHPWNVADKVLLIGDAAHAVVPFYGQGMNAAFEDCLILDKMIDRYQNDWKGLLADFSHERKPDADAIADLAISNFLEMRDKVGSTWFLTKKKCEKILHRTFPRWYTPLYNMVSFSQIPYNRARKKAATQSLFVQCIMTAIFVLVLWAVLSFIF